MARQVFCGENDIDQLCVVLRVLGTEELNAWPGAKELPDYGKIEFSPMEPTPLQEVHTHFHAPLSLISFSPLFDPIELTPNDGIF